MNMKLFVHNHDAQFGSHRPVEDPRFRYNHSPTTLSGVKSSVSIMKSQSHHWMIAYFSAKNASESNEQQNHGDGDCGTSGSTSA